VHELAEIGLIDHAAVEVREHPSVPLFALYLINNADAFRLSPRNGAAPTTGDRARPVP
jgi:hypothetical protein